MFVSSFPMLSDDRPLTPADQQRFAAHVGRDWKRVGRALQKSCRALKGPAIDNLAYEYEREGLYEQAYQLLGRFIQSEGRSAKLSRLISALEETKLTSMAEIMLGIQPRDWDCMRMNEWCVCVCVLFVHVWFFPRCISKFEESALSFLWKVFSSWPYHFYLSLTWNFTITCLPRMKYVLNKELFMHISCITQDLSSTLSCLRFIGSGKVASQSRYVHKSNKL